MKRLHPRWRLIIAIVWLVTATCGHAADNADTLFDEETYRSLVAENKALRVGDIITVIVQEAASATSTADSGGQREFSLSTLLETPRAGSRSAQARMGSENDGTGRTQRTGRLLAQLSVRVLEVTSNGDLLIAGQQSLQINGEEQLITLSGVVRARDIAENNTVLSSRIALARIQFDGQGFVTDQSKPGWLTRLINYLGL
jgi:flagellar L-ring protein FlgH